jgi:hypothetical protein
MHRRSDLVSAPSPDLALGPTWLTNMPAEDVSRALQRISIGGNVPRK